jgi:Cu/Ag efflux protein CusF
MNLKAPLLASLVTLVALTANLESKAAEPLNIENLQTMSATVEAIDLDKRMVSLRGTEGRTATFEVAPDVRNLPQVKVGDKLVVHYYQSMAAEIKAKGTSKTLGTVDQAAGAAHAAPGAKPGAVVGSTVTTTVVIQSVDKTNHSVMFKGSDGLVRSVPVKRPEGQKFIATLKQGDEVEITYTEALAVNIEATK